MAETRARAPNSPPSTKTMTFRTKTYLDEENRTVQKNDLVGIRTRASIRPLGRSGVTKSLRGAKVEKFSAGIAPGFFCVQVQNSLPRIRPFFFLHGVTTIFQFSRKFQTALAIRFSSFSWLSRERNVVRAR